MPRAGGARARRARWSCGPTRTRRRGIRSRSTACRDSDRLIIERGAASPGAGARARASATCRSRSDARSAQARPDVALHARPRRRVARCCGSRAAAAAGRLRIARLRRRTSRRRCRELRRDARRRRAPAKLRRLAAARGGRLARAPTATSRSRRPRATSCTRPIRRRGRGSRSSPTACGRRQRRAPAARADRRRRSRSATPDTCIRGRASTSCSRRSRRCRRRRGLIVGGHEKEPDLARLRRWRRTLGIADARHVHRPGRRRPSVPRPSARGDGARAAEPGVGDLDALHVAAEAVRVHGRRPADRRLRPAVDPRGAARRRATRCWSSRAAAARSPPASGASLDDRGARPNGWRAAALDDVPRLHLGAPRRAARGAFRAGDVAAPMISDRLLHRSSRCPACQSATLGPVDGRDRVDLVVRGCGRRYRAAGRDFLDLRPSDEFAEQTKYLDEALHADARHERVSPPLLGSKIRNDMLRAFLAPRPAISSSISAAAAAARCCGTATGGATPSASTSARSSPTRRGARSTCCSAICAGCRSPTARSPRRTRSTCSSTCRRRRCAAC